ncbi:MAG TPA: hypothetical protein VFP61_12415 [Acidimicrobiales bacterium]|nr:hypothetical protein [Acidimicrobiales bacterium]
MTFSTVADAATPTIDELHAGDGRLRGRPRPRQAEEGRRGRPLRWPP